MGRLIGLELYNFKSYRGTSYIGFGTSHFTSIIGPNGSGKSNMMDAISFVLGIRSVHLRSSKLRDLIYRGRMLTRDSDVANAVADHHHGDSEDEEDDEEAGATHSTDDPTEAYVIAIYEKADKTIFKFKRAISSSGSSVYSINDKVVTASQYAEILKKENILIKARNFLVFQGDVEKIASQSSEELSSLLETVSGSIEFKKRYDELAEEKDQVHIEALNLNSKKRALKEDYNQYKAQVSEFELYERLTEEKTNLIMKKYLCKLYIEEVQLDEFTTKIGEFKESIKDLISQQKALKTSSETLQSKIAREQLKSKKSERVIQERELDAKRKKLELIPLTAQITHTEDKVKDYSKRILSLEADFKRQAEVVKNAERQVAKITQDYTKFLEDYNATAPIGLSIEDLDEYNRLREEFLMKGGHVESKLIGLKDTLNELEAQLEILSKEKSFADSRMNDLKIQKSELEEKFQDNKASINESLALCDAKKRQLNVTKAERESILREEIQLTTEMKNVLVELSDYNASRRETEREKKLRDNVLSLRRLFPGVHGLVSDLCSPTQKKYATAIAAILGKNFDAVIVDTTATAQKCIAKLKESRTGFSTFIPLDSVDTKPIPSILRSLHEGVRPTIDVMKYDEKYERAAQYICSDSVICDDIRVAKYVKWEKNLNVKAVTLDGSLIHKSGLMTGGQGKNTTKTWDKANISKMNEAIMKKDDLKIKISTLQAKKPSEMLDKRLMDELSIEENNLVSLNHAKNDIERLLQDKETEINHQLTLVQKAEEGVNEMQLKINEANSAVKAFEVELEEVQNSVYESFCKKLGFSHGIKEYEGSQGVQLREHIKNKARFTKQITFLENKREFEAERISNIERRIEKLNADKAVIEAEHNSFSTRGEELQNEINFIDSEIEVLKETFVDNAKKLSTYITESKNVAEKLKDINAQVDEKMKAANLDDEGLKKLKTERYNTFKNCKLETVAIPLIKGSLDDIVIEKESADEEDEDTESGNTVDVFEDFEIDYQSISEDEVSEDWSTMEKSFNDKIREATEQLSNMTPNTKARERLQAVQENLEEVNIQFNEVKIKEKEIITKFTEVKNERYSAFIKAFESVAGNIDSIYKELTKSSISPLGGSAYLTLEDDDEPYLAGVKYHAMPPMKRFRDMDLLSGGEKTIAALALLFAIHSFHPSPFFVLDEVDAALDNANVNKIANYITSHSGPDFQFIVISLKNTLFEKSDALVGIYREQALNSSKVLTLDLRGYPDQTEAKPLPSTTTA